MRQTKTGLLGFGAIVTPDDPRIAEPSSRQPRTR
jgi:hypothetical protein